VYTIPELKVERALNLTYDPRSSSYTAYRDFVQTFGADQFVLLAVRTPAAVSDRSLLSSLGEATSQLERIEGVHDVLSLTNARLPRTRRGLFGAHPVVQQERGTYTLNMKELDDLRTIQPMLGTLVSTDLRTLGILITLQESHGFGPHTRQIIEQAKQIIRKNLPQGSEIHEVGVPVLTLAFQRYNLQTAWRVGLLAALIATLVAVYIFKSLRVTILALVSGGLAVLWLLGIMSLMGVRVHMVTSVSFGVIFILTMPTVIHIVSHFNERYPSSSSKEDALLRALAVVARPCLMCSITTAAGFGSLMLSPMKVISQMGLIMSSGMVLSFFLTMIVSSNYLVFVRPLSDRAYKRMKTDLLSAAFKRTGDFVFTRPRWCLTGGLILVAVMVAGIPRIKSDAPGMHMLRENSPEAVDIRFVRDNLVPVSALSIVVGGVPGQFTDSSQWKHAKDVIERIEGAKGVLCTANLIPLLENLHASLSGGDEQGSGLFENPRVIPELLFLISSSLRGKLLLDSHLSADRSKLHVSVFIDPASVDTLHQVLERIRHVAASHWQGKGSVVVTGHLALVVAQTSGLLKAQVISLVAAFFLIIMLLALQFRSITLALLSLIPNVLPLAVMFGIMGWFGIYLDSLTVIVAVISFGLSVDDTIHYVTQLKRQTRNGSHQHDIKQSLLSAYRVTGRALISTSAVLCLGFLAFLWSPYVPGIAFGILAASAIAAALVGDLIFMPAAILSSPSIATFLERRLRGRSEPAVSR
jgi:predicted RND superfamily exporter protein